MIAQNSNKLERTRMAFEIIRVALFQLRDSRKSKPEA